MRALLIGKRASVLADLAEALNERGHEVIVDRDAAMIGADERFDVVAFGRAIKDDVRRAVMDRVRSRNPRAQRVDGLAPITDLLVVQCEWAGRRSTGATAGDPVVLVEAVPVPRVVVRPVPTEVAVGEIEVVRHRLTPWFSSRAVRLDAEREASDVAAYFGRQPSGSRDFVSVRLAGEAIFVGDALGRLPLCQ
jgi:hypothetical protein